MQAHVPIKWGQNKLMRLQDAFFIIIQYSWLTEKQLLIMVLQMQIISRQILD